jgi:3'(2'), 5'-bisphosphate nucleotidase
MVLDADTISNLAISAGIKVREIYESRSYESSIAYKADKSPLTIADLESNRIIVSGLNDIEPRYPVLSEEGPIAPFDERKSWRRYWLVDPLDGTDEFLLRNGEFTVNIALIDSGRPIMGAIYLPVQEVLYYADANGSFRRRPGEELQRISSRKNVEPQDLTAVMSRLHFNEADRAFLKKNGIKKCMPMGSSIKFCLIAEGSADVYYQGSRNMEWDTGAGQAIVEKAGGAVLDERGEALRYNKELLFNGLYLCSGSPSSIELKF